MNKIIPFTKVITLSETFDEIKKIALDDTLKLEEPYLVKGDLIVRGCYKTEEREEDFNYPMPVEIAIDEKYDTSKCSIGIDDFYYEIINEQNIRINIDLVLDDLFYKEKEEVVEEIKVEDDRNDYENYFDEIEVEAKEATDDLLVNTLLNDNDVKKAEILNTNNSNNIVKEDKTKDFNESMEDLFKETSDDKEYCIYRVYVMSENDTLEYVLNKYQVTKEDLMPFNDLDKLQVGTKLIIPSIDE